MSNQNLKIMATIFFSLFLTLGPGCDKGKNPTEPKNDMTLVGLWKLIHYSSVNQGETTTITEDQIKLMGINWTFDIKADGTVVQKSNLNGPPTTYTGTWQTDGKTLTMTMASENDERLAFAFEYTIAGSILKLTWQVPNGPTIYGDFRKQ